MNTINERRHAAGIRIYQRALRTGDRRKIRRWVNVAAKLLRSQATPISLHELRTGERYVSRAMFAG